MLEDDSDAGPWIGRKDLLIGVGARDALEAKLIEQAGFDFVWSSSLAISAAYAVPDASLIAMNQYLQAARSMSEAVEIPVLADCDTGYGNENNVIYAVKQFEAAGVAGACFEDKRFPKENSLLAGGRQDLAPMEEFAAKITAAVETRKSRNFVIVARVEALVAGCGQQEASRRACCYAAAGADCILIHSRSPAPDEILEFARRWEQAAPLVLVPTTYPSLTEDKIKALGNVRLVIYANQPLRAAVRAQAQLLARIRDTGGIHAVEDLICPLRRIFELQGAQRPEESAKTVEKF